MRFYVQKYDLQASNTIHPIREMGSPSPVGVAMGAQDFQIHCDLVPILDAGESIDDILKRLSLWLNGSEVNMVRATPNFPRCFYCGEINDSGKVKCPNCGGGARDNGQRHQ